jgi:type III restriction enzyme
MITNRLLNTINARLSLRAPQRESLAILADVLEQIELGKQADLVQALSVIQSLYPTVTDFEREFPSLCFALATGVGKTRLMGAFIAYLYLSGRSRHFFVLAPGLTVYDKLIADFSPESPKYVFKGVAEFATNRPIIVTGDNYEQGQGVRFDLSAPGSGVQGRLFETGDTVHINIFNISKINSEVRGGNAPRIKRLQEYIGESYFEYLSVLPDLVLLMDEAHRYRGTAGARAINELKPILGLELTATPKSTGAKPLDFKNVIYSYPLGQAMEDGFVKEPAVATRSDFKPEDYALDALEQIKLEDGIHNHEHVKAELVTYAAQSGAALVHPFMLVVAQDVEHAKQLRELIESDGFFEGRYKGRVIEVHYKGSEQDDQRLLQVEHDPETEIVIHVNKLKEGWDVTNLYTIVPLRASASEILTEQTIGRGLRLPFGRRTGVDSIDRLVIIAHDRFKAVVDAAKDPNSIIRKTITIGAGGDVPHVRPLVVEVPSVIETMLTGADTIFDGKGFSEPLQQPLVLKTAEERKVASIVLEVMKGFEKLESSQKLIEPAVQAQIEAKVRERMAPAQLQLEGVAKPIDLTPIVQAVTQTVAQYSIDIPNIVLVPTKEVSYGFRSFVLQNLSSIRLQPISQEILIQHLRTNDRSFLNAIGTIAQEARPEDYIVGMLIDHNEIDYDSHADLLYELSQQMVMHLRSYLGSDEDVENVLLHHRKGLAEFIFAQMMQEPNYWETPTDYEVRISKGFSTPKRNNFTSSAGEAEHDFRQPVRTKADIRRMLFKGFAKCFYPRQKFDSDPERSFAVLLEDEKSVMKWMKPAAGHFQIEWKSGSAYEPDFAVETDAEKLICEVKARNEVSASDVQAKARAAVRWCENASTHAEQFGGKPWSYLLIPDDEISTNRTLAGLKASFCISAVGV